MTQQQGYTDPFAQPPKVPSVSWANARPGDSITGRVVALPELVQARDFVSGQLETWPDGQPKWNVVTHLDIDGEERGLWCVKPSALFGAIADAIKESGAHGTEIGGVLKVTYTGDKPAERAGMNPARQFKVEYRPPNAFDGYGSNGYAQPRQEPWQQPAQPSQLQQHQQQAGDFRREQQNRPPVAPQSAPQYQPQQSPEPPF